MRCGGGFPNPKNRAAEPVERLIMNVAVAVPPPGLANGRIPSLPLGLGVGEPARQTLGSAR